MPRKFLSPQAAHPIQIMDKNYHQDKILYESFFGTNCNSKKMPDRLELRVLMF